MNALETPTPGWHEILIDSEVLLSDPSGSLPVLAIPKGWAVFTDDDSPTFRGQFIVWRLFLIAPPEAG